MIVIDCTMEELRELLDGKSIPLDPQGPLMPFDPDKNAGRQAPAAEQDEPLPSRLDLLKKAIGVNEEEVWAYFAVNNLPCASCPMTETTGGLCGGDSCRIELIEWVRQDPALEGEER